MNLKKLLMDLGNRLVTERGFNPANYPGKSTKPILDFTNWLNRTPDAIEILAEVGVEWPIVKRN